MSLIDFSRDTALYRLFDNAGALLYVGMAFDPDARCLKHQYEKPWWHEVAHREVEWFADRRLAREAEAKAIKTESPRYNRSGRPLPLLAESADGQLRFASLSQVRARLRDVVDSARDQDAITAIVQRGRPRAFVVSVPFFERAERDAALLGRLREQHPELLDELSADLIEIAVPQRLPVKS